MPVHSHAGSAVQLRAPGDFGSNWFAMLDPIRRYMKGFDLALVDRLIGFFVDARGAPLTDDEEQGLRDILGQHEYQIPFPAMPMQEGIEYARFLAELVVNHHRFAVGAPIVGGRVRVGSVTYRGGRFQILDA